MCRADSAAVAITTTDLVSKSIAIESQVCKNLFSVSICMHMRYCDKFKPMIISMHILRGNCATCLNEALNMDTGSRTKQEQLLLVS